MEINIKKASEILGMARGTIYAMQERGELPDPITAIAIMMWLQNRENDLNAVKNRLGEFLKESTIKVN